MNQKIVLFDNLKVKTMYKNKDDQELALEMNTHLWLWANKQIAKKVEYVEQINPLSISSIKQKLMKQKQSPLQRINRIIKFYSERGINKESVNCVYRKIINSRL
jgi:hypothetical protein